MAGIAGRGVRIVGVAGLGLALVTVLGTMALLAERGTETSLRAADGGPSSATGRSLGLDWRSVEGDITTTAMPVDVDGRVFVLDTPETGATLLVWDGDAALRSIPLEGGTDIARILSIDADAETDRLIVALMPRLVDSPLVATGSIDGPLAISELPVPDGITREGTLVGWVSLTDAGYLAAGSGSLGRALGAHTVPLRWTSVDGSTWAVERISLEPFGSPPEGYVDSRNDLVLTTTDDETNAATLGTYYSTDSHHWVDVTDLWSALTLADGPSDVAIVDGLLQGVVGLDGILHRWSLPTEGSHGADEPLQLPVGATPMSRFAAGRLGVALTAWGPEGETLFLSRDGREWRQAAVLSLPGVNPPPGWATNVNALAVGDRAVALQIVHTPPDDGDESRGGPPLIARLVVGGLPE